MQCGIRSESGFLTQLIMLLITSEKCNTTWRSSHKGVLLGQILKPNFLNWSLLKYKNDYFFQVSVYLRALQNNKLHHGVVGFCLFVFFGGRMQFCFVLLKCNG